MIIYLLTNKKNGKKYVGQTIHSLEKRMKEHCRKRQMIVDRAIAKYGIDNFLVETIDYADTIDELNEKERKWVEIYDCIVPNGYNQCAGGGNTMGYHHKKETKRKMAEKKKGMYFGKDNPFYNKHHTEETREKMRAVWKNEEYKRKQIERLHSCKHATKRVKCLETGKIFDSIEDCAKEYNAIATHISRVCKGKRKHTRGYSFEYVN